MLDTCVISRVTLWIIAETGAKVFAYAPSADASRGTLREVGFEQADTVARQLLGENLQRGVQNQIIWIDEAGLLGTDTMGQLFNLAGKLEARVVLSGDRRQHGAVARGAALRLLEEEAGLVPAEIREIQRQKGDYKQAVHALSEGRIADGLHGASQSLCVVIRAGRDEPIMGIQACDAQCACQHLVCGHSRLKRSTDDSTSEGHNRF